MSFKVSDIRRKKQALLEDLKALERVEAMFAADRRPRKGADSVPKEIASKQTVMPLQVEPHDAGSNGNQAERGSLKSMVITALKNAGREGIRPKDIVAYVIGQGYPFSSDAVAASSISTALQRQFKNYHTVEKTEEGKYFWKG
jgi:hypothetical protein